MAPLHAHTDCSQQSATPGAHPPHLLQAKGRDVGARDARVGVVPQHGQQAGTVPEGSKHTAPTDDPTIVGSSADPNGDWECTTRTQSVTSNRTAPNGVPLLPFHLSTTSTSTEVCVLAP